MDISILLLDDSIFLGKQASADLILYLTITEINWNFYTGKKKTNITHKKNLYKL